MEVTGMFGREPAVWIGAINAILALAVGFGLPLTSTKVGLINATVAALLGLYTRSQVSPTAAQPARQPEHV
jgi:hypothetical protein